ncbi:MAG: hypothetical protein MN733_13330 [Nitrososphaera sp.]|nr:hypothetical protein [Nitrososphaera sp.]
MNIETANELIVSPTLRWLYLLGSEGYTEYLQRMRIMLLAIGQTESGFKTRHQRGGPAMGYWQFEIDGGCAEFEKDKRLGSFRKAARDLGFPNLERSATWFSLGQGCDHLACIMARAILWLEPKALPEVGDVEEAYRQYLNRWRPGRPSKERFLKSYDLAVSIDRQKH